MPMIVTDPHKLDNPIIFANRAFLSMTGYAADEIVGLNCRFLQGPNTDRLTVAGIREAIEQRREHSTEILNYRKDGSTFWNALFLSPVFNERKELVYYFASQLDVSRRRDAEEALAQSQKMEALGQLTGGISHDFNNLLQVIAGQLDLLNFKLRAPEIDREKALRNVEGARQSVSRAATLTQQLLAFSRKQRLEGRPINLNTSASGIVEMIEQSFTNRAPDAQITVDLRLDPTLRNCQIDPSQLEVAMLNVLLNARDAMPAGGSITIKTANVSVERSDSVSFGGLPEGDYVSISMTDTGGGIPKEIVQRVMEPFFTTKEEGKGTGLGLSMVYGFTKQSGGTTQIYSEVGLGTTVRLFFPATASEVREAHENLPRMGVRGGHERVLVVDDRPEVAQVAQDLLESLGYQVQTVLSAHEALATVDALPADQKPQLLFTDIIMPGSINGIVLARAMREKVPGIHVLLTTGYAGDVSARNADMGSEFDVIFKPYRQEDLARKVRMVIDGATGSNLQPG